MSWRAIFWCNRLRDVPGTRKAVLMQLCIHHNPDDGKCYPSSERIAAQAGFTVSHVNKAIQELERDGQIATYWHAPTKQASKGFRAFHLTIKDVDAPGRDEAEFQRLATAPATSALGSAIGAEDNAISAQKETSKQIEKKGGSRRRLRAEPTPVPETLSDSMKERAVELGFSEAQIQSQWRRFALTQKQDSKEHSNWIAAWELWLTNRTAPEPEGRRVPAAKDPTGPLPNEGSLSHSAQECLALMRRGTIPDSTLEGKFTSAVVAEARRFRVAEWRALAGSRSRPQAGT